MGVMRLWRRLASPRPGIFLASLLMAVLSLGSGVALLAVSTWLIMRASEQPAILTLTVAIVSVRFFGLARPVFRYVERVLSHDAVLRTLGTIRSRMISSLSTSSPTHPLFARRGELLSRLVGDVEKSQDYFLRLVSPVLSAVLVIGLASGLEFLIDPRAGLIMAGGLGSTLVVASLLSAFTARTAASAVERGHLSGAINELVRGAEELHMWQASARELQRVLVLDAAVTARARRSVRGLGAGSFVILLGLGLTIATIIPGVLTGYRGQSMAWPTMAVLILLPLALLDVLLPVPQAMAIAAEVRSSLERIDAVIDQPTTTTVSAPTGNGLSLRNARLSWDGNRDQVDTVSLEIPAGVKVAIVGASGAGKTTLATLLAGLVAPHYGQVMIDDVELALLSDAERATKVAFAAQDAYLFNTSIRENLLIADPSLSDERLVALLTQVGLGEWIAAVGLDHIVGENGERLSGGQRRRLTIARALAVEAPITIVDEPTAHLDLFGGDTLLRRLFQGPGTRIVITHRLAPLAEGLADLIVVMDHGRIAEMGTHADLMQVRGLYHSLRVAEGERPLAPAV